MSDTQSLIYCSYFIKKLFHKIPAQSILTPHPKEFDRLFGLHKSRESQIQTAIEKAKEYNVILVLKGHETIVTNGDLLLKNTTGNTGLAKGGSGDALTGLLTSLLAQKYEPWIAAQLGVYLHGLAADVAIQSQSQESLLITDVIECFGQAFNSIRECKVCPGGSNNF
jgi:NAD(P)H-hydrate epimerase